LTSANVLKRGKKTERSNKQKLQREENESLKRTSVCNVKKKSSCFAYLFIPRINDNNKAMHYLRTNKLAGDAPGVFLTCQPSLSALTSANGLKRKNSHMKVICE
jgi:hypothetical protein